MSIRYYHIVRVWFLVITITTTVVTAITVTGVSVSFVDITTATQPNNCSA